MKRYYLQAPKGKPIQWPAWKPLDSYFSAIQEIFGLGRDDAERYLRYSHLRTSDGICFFRMGEEKDGRTVN